MSVNLNILANKAIRGYANVDDISTAVDIYTSGSSYTLYAINNDANIPITGIPQQASYCSQSILQVSQTSNFSSAVTESYINCNSSSLSGSYLYYGSFTDNDQSGGFLDNNFGYIYPIMDTTIGYDQINSGIGKTYYFRNKKVADFGYIGEWSNVDSVNLMLPNNNSNSIFNNNNFIYMWEAKGYDNINHIWYRNYPPTFISGSNPNAGGNPYPVSFDATASIATGTIVPGIGNPEIIMYGNGGSPALKTNGSTFYLPMDSSMVQRDYVLTYCVIQGSIVGSSIPDNGNSINFWADIAANTAQVQAVGAGLDEIITISPTDGVRGNPIGISTRWSSISPSAFGVYNIECAGVSGTEKDWASAGSGIQAQSFRLKGPFTISTSNDCILRFIGLQIGYNNQYNQFVSRYKQINGDYTGSLGGS